MKRNIIIVFMILIASIEVYSEENFSAGFEIGEIGNDLIIGGRITSPFILNGSAAFRLSGDTAVNNTDSFCYGYFRGGLIGTGGIAAGLIRLYGEGGISILWNAEDSSQLVIGGYGLFGFEFFTAVNSPVSYFIELGTLGISISRLNGFNVRTGMSVYL